MKKYLITYTNTEILSISDAPEEGVIACGSKMLIATIDDSLIMFSALTFDISKLEKAKENEAFS